MIAYRGECAAKSAGKDESQRRVRKGSVFQTGPAKE